MSFLPADLRYAARSLRRTPGFTLTAIAALALGIGANTAIFSVVNMVLLEPLPYPDPDRLVQLMAVSEVGNQNIVSVQKFTVWRDFNSVFDPIAAYEIGGPSVTLTPSLTQPLSRPGFREALRVARVSSGYFRLFGAQVALGRTFTTQEDQPGGPRVAVIGDNLWRRGFGGDPSLPGRTVLLERESYKIIGVLAPGFIMDSPSDIWLPLQADPNSSDHVSRVRVAARLKPGFTMEEARSAMNATMRPFLRRYSGTLVLFRESFTAISLRDALVGDVKPALYLLMGAVGFLLLISCANTASLVLARAARRTREIAIRAALGAERKQIIRQLFAESVLLSGAGGAVGITAGYFGVRALLALGPANIAHIIPRIGTNGFAIELNWRVLLFTVAVSAVTCILFGLAPAVKASRPDVSTLVKDSAAQSGMQWRRGRGRSALVIAETALALVLLAGAGLLVRSFVAARAINRGFDERNVLTLEMSLAGAQFEKTTLVAQLVRSTSRRLKLIPGVSAVAAASALPLGPSLAMPFTVHRHDQTLVGRYHGTATWHSVSPGYFDAFRIRLLRGRMFTDDDDRSAAGVVLINRAMMKKYWQDVDANPIGEFIIIGKGMGTGVEEGPRQIVGVVGDVRDAGLSREPMIYVPMAQVPDRLNPHNRLLPIAWVVRAADAAPALASAIQQELREASGGLPLQRIRTMHEVVAASSARNQFYTTLLAVFAGAALLLAAVGLYGLMTFSVQQRTQEIGIRMALGAGPRQVRNMVVWQGMRLALIGISIGIPTALALTRLMVGMIFGIATWDPLVFGAVAALMGAVAWPAAYVPSVRATRVQPVESLRY